MVVKPGFRKAELLNPLPHVFRVLARAAHAGEIPLDIREKHRHAHLAEGLREHLQGDGLSGSRRTGDQSVAVCHLRLKEKIPSVKTLCNPDLIVSKHSKHSCPWFFCGFLISP